jgi:2',3'-cyclic-nucleotide 2'-phosphodiesterase (5'-nucleotidase family)
MPTVGGLARRASVIAKERKVDGLVLVLDAGGSLIGDQDPARASQGKSSIEAMNHLGYDAVVLSTADLALGPQSLRQRIAEAKFDVLSANMTVTDTGEPLAKPFVIREYAGHRIALVGLSDLAVASGGINVQDPLEAAQRVVAEARKQADVVILVSHAGAATNQQIADQVSGIAAVVSGGVPAAPGSWVSQATGVPTYHADEASPGHAGRVLGVAALKLDAQGKLTSQSWRRIPLTPEVGDDPEMLTWVNAQTQ